MAGTRRIGLPGHHGSGLETLVRAAVLHHMRAWTAGVASGTGGRWLLHVREVGLGVRGHGGVGLLLLSRWWTVHVATAGVLGDHGDGAHHLGGVVLGAAGVGLGHGRHCWVIVSHECFE